MNMFNTTPRIFSLFILLIILSISCDQNMAPELIITNAKVWTATDTQAEINTIVVKDGRISELGDQSLSAKAKESTKIVDVQGAFVMPGLIEGHGHFSGLGKSLIKLNLLKTKNWEEIIQMVEEKVKESEPGEWIEGRGWHQEKWDNLAEEHVHGYPYHYELSAISPDNPVLLYHASGHSLFANEKAMELAGVTKETISEPGGEIVRDIDGHAVGVFEERAMSVIRKALQVYEMSLSEEEKNQYWHDAIEKAQVECLQKGITSFQDAGSKLHELERYQALAKAGKFDLRLWAMVRDSLKNVEPVISNLRMIDVANGWFTCNAIKTEIDGALGSYGAWLLEAYDDKEDFYGQNTTELEEVERFAEMAEENNMQLCVHAIGDRGNQEILNLFEKIGHTKEKDWRWRIEHAQHLSVPDIARFATMGVIASMQAVHCTSDSPFVVKRLGDKRAREGAYAWRSLIDAGAVVTNGTDAPVEDVDPLASIYASVTRKRVGYDEAFYPEQSMTREEALRSYTIINAYGAFEEDKKGSIEIGKYADFTILDKDLLRCSEEEILDAQVLYTIVNGQVKYNK